MSPEEQKVFDDAREMFLTDGWKQLQEDLQSNLDTLTVESLNSEKEFWIAKGQINVLRLVLGYENMMLAAEEEVADETYL